MQLPEDRYILLSLVNTKLRDDYASLGELCAAEGADEALIVERLAEAGFVYDAESNAFKRR